MENMGRPAGLVAEAAPQTWRRETRGGRTLEYELKVIQEPERARACGSGAKSSADRRPVDPPPVVELRIHDLNGNGPKGKEDVTFSYEANFFLFATLEVARVIAPHRGQAPSQQVPVLTGMPVSGMAYLDRPKEAGYFIFPDLSVRHEGCYRLSFNLYEETKKLEDTDKDVAMDGKKIVGGTSPDASFDWRMEVKSEKFTVYSAKKFPGLAESTNLSRTVAEQGCRVRIRRDVRMRRRDGKGNGDFDEVPEEDHRGRAAEQEQYIRERTRSISAVSEEAQQRSNYTGSPIVPTLQHGNHLGFIAQTQQFVAPPPLMAPQQFTPQAPPPAHSNYQPPPPAAYPPPGAPSYRSQQTQPPHYYPQERHPQSAYPTFPPREQREPFEQDRRASYAAPSYAPQAPQQGFHYSPPDNHYPPHPSHGYASHPSENSGLQTKLPPLKIVAAETKYESLSSPAGQVPSIRHLAPSLASPVYERSQQQPGFYDHYTAPQPAPESQRNGGKRPFGHAFKESSNADPLRNGMRPSEPVEDAEDDIEKELGKMEYKRADGTQIRRALPPGHPVYGQ